MKRVSVLLTKRSALPVMVAIILTSAIGCPLNLRNLNPKYLYVDVPTTTYLKGQSSPFQPIGQINICKLEQRRE